MIPLKVSQLLLKTIQWSNTAFGKKSQPFPSWSLGPALLSPSLAALLQVQGASSCSGNLPSLCAFRAVSLLCPLCFAKPLLATEDSSMRRTFWERSLSYLNTPGPVPSSCLNFFVALTSPRNQWPFTLLVCRLPSPLLSSLHQLECGLHGAGAACCGLQHGARSISKVLVQGIMDSSREGIRPSLGLPWVLENLATFMWGCWEPTLSQPFWTAIWLSRPEAPKQFHSIQPKQFFF